MNSRRHKKLVQEGDYLAQVDVELIDEESEVGWAPYLSLEDAYKLDEVRIALKRGDIKRATELAKVFTLTPVDN